MSTIAAGFAGDPQATITALVAALTHLRGRHRRPHDDSTSPTTEVVVVHLPSEWRGRVVIDATGPIDDHAA